MAIALFVFAGATAAGAQLLPRLPALPIDTPSLPPVARGLADDVLRAPSDAARMLDQARRAAIAQLVRDNPDRVALDPDGFPARAGEVVVDDPKDSVIAAAVAQGYRVIERGDVLGVAFVRLAVPGQRSLKSAIREIRKFGGEVSADQLHTPSGMASGRPAPIASGDGTLIGVIDGGVAGAA